MLKLINKNELNEKIEIHNTLNPKLWDEENNLLPEVRDKIINIVNQFLKYIKQDAIDFKIEDIYLLGSNANFNYNNESDLDIHIIVDESFDCNKKHLPLIYNAYKALFNRKYSITIRGINVEIYVENAKDLSSRSTGIYSIKKGWIKNPIEYQIPDIDQTKLDALVQDWENKYFELTTNPTKEKIDNYIDSIYILRQESLQTKGEFGLGNLVFKEIRRLGYLDDLKELTDELTSKELSLESLNYN